MNSVSGNSSFDARLESLRGLAAAAVVITHALATMSVDGISSWWSIPLSDHTVSTFLLFTLTAFFNASSAVVLFFVLSGYVLTLSLKRDEPFRSLPTYFIRRAFRLLPPMWISIFVFYFSVRFAITADITGTHFWGSITEPLSLLDILSSALMFESKVNPVIWTMYVEIIGSLLLPVIVVGTAILSERIRWFTLLPFAVLTLLFPECLTTRYLICFQTGVVLALGKRFSLNWSPKLLLMAGLAGFIIERFAYSGYGSVSILLNTGSSAAIIYAVTLGSYETFLSSALIRGIGKVSYSVYLLHLSVLIIVTVAVAGLNLPPIVAVIMICFLTLVGSISIGRLGYILVEYPAISVGRFITEQYVGERRGNS